jgi:hypothetical protein
MCVSTLGLSDGISLSRTNVFSTGSFIVNRSVSFGMLIKFSFFFLSL